jgi:hypothetical protein
VTLLTYWNNHAVIGPSYRGAAIPSSPCPWPSAACENMSELEQGLPSSVCTHGLFMPAVSMSVTPLQSRPNPAYSALSLKFTLSPLRCPTLTAPGIPPRLGFRTLSQGHQWQLPLLALRHSIASKSRCFAYVAGSTAVLARLDDELQLSRRFHRAHPTAVPSKPPASNAGLSTPITSAADARYRSLTPVRERGMSSSVGAGSSIGDWGDSPSSRT